LNQRTIYCCGIPKPEIQKRAETDDAGQAHALIVSTVKLVVAGYSPDTQGCGEASQNRKQLLLRLAMSFKKITE
jgi:hypothetical protein